MTSQLTLGFAQPLNNHARLSSVIIKERDEPMILQFLEGNPGLTHKQLLKLLNQDRPSPISADQLRRFIIQLEDEGKVGLYQIIRPPKKEAPHQNFGGRINLRVHWAKAGGKAKGDHKYPWLYDGSKPIKYIGGGNEKSPTAQARVELVEDWIKQGLGKDEIIGLIPKLQTHLKKKLKRSQS
ncbi:MAG: hypothetical protein ACRC8A_12590 [Microcoleaceae cyanobacterium]